MRYLAAIVVIIALAGAYLLFGQSNEVVSSGSSEKQPQKIAVATSTLSEKTADYEIDVVYPQFGISKSDSFIRAAITEAANALKKQAATDQPSVNGFRPYELDGVFGDISMESDVVSFRETLAQDTGGAHPLPVVRTFNFDPRGGAPLSLQEALSLTGKTFEGVATEAKKQLQAQLGVDVLWPQGADPTSENYAAYLVTKNKVKFIFQPYQVAPYAAGFPEVSFPRVK